MWPKSYQVGPKVTGDWNGFGLTGLRFYERDVICRKCCTRSLWPGAQQQLPPPVLCKHFQTLVYGEAPHPLWQNGEKQKCWNTRVVFIQNIGLLNQLCPFFFHLLTKLQGVQLQIYSVCQCVERCHDDRAQSVVKKWQPSSGLWFQPSASGDGQHQMVFWWKITLLSLRSLWATLVQKICLMLVFLLVATDDIILVMDPCTAGCRCKSNS